MQRTILAASAVLLAFAFLISLPHRTTAQTTYSTPVKVVNSGASQAVPVAPQGTTPVTGTVTIGNTTLPVTISNDMSHAVPVKVSVTPWDYHGSCNLGSGLSECYAIGQTAAPANGQILQTIACNGQLPAGDTGYVDVQYRNEANPFDSAYRDVEFPLQRVGPSPYEGVDEYAGVQNVSVPVYTAFNVIVVHTASVSGKVSCTAAGYQF